MAGYNGVDRVDTKGREGCLPWAGRVPRYPASKKERVRIGRYPEKKDPIPTQDTYPTQYHLPGLGTQGRYM